eukprot:5562047-Pleurochrysis_carterae.AAC.2
MAVQSDHLRHPVRQRGEANRLEHSAVTRRIARRNPLRMRRRLATPRPQRPEQMRRSAECAFEGAMQDRSQTAVRRGSRRRASDPRGRRAVEAARLRRGTSGVYGRNKNLKSAHTSGIYPAVGEDAAW